MSAAELVARLAQETIDPQLLAEIAQELFCGESERKALADRRRSERERKANQRVKSREVTGQAVKSGDKGSNDRDNLTSKAQVSEPSGSSPSPRPWSLPAGVSLQVWTDFLSNRKRKRFGNTDTAWKGFCDDLKRVSSQTGIPPPKLIEHAAAKGWGSINKPDEPKHGQPASNVTSLRGSRPDPALDLYRAACAAEDREDNLRAGTALPAIGSGGP